MTYSKQIHHECILLDQDDITTSQTLIIVIEIQCIVQIYLALICGECHALLELLFTQGGGAQLGMALVPISDF